MTTSIESLKRIAWLTTTGLFFLFFYSSSGAGLNWLLFSLTVAGFVYLTGKSSKTMHKVVLALLTIMAGVATFMHGTNLAIVSVVISLLCVTSFLSNAIFTLWEGLLVAAFNAVCSPFLMAYRTVKGLQTKMLQKNGISIQKFLPLALVVAFGFLYYFASPVFANFINRFDLSSFVEIFMTIAVGALVSTTIFYAISPNFLSKLYQNQQHALKWFHLDSWHSSWKFGLIALNALLALVVLSDAYYRLVLNALPEGLSYSEYLHQGFFSLIVSTLLASFLSLAILYKPAFASDKMLSLSAFTFVILNGVFVLQTALRNAVYIQEYGLTEKRVAVFAYLILCVVTVVITLGGLRKQLAPHFLYRQMGWSSLIVLVLAAQINWSKMITRYNLSNVPHANKTIDYDYLLSLNESNLPLLLTHKYKMNNFAQERLDNKCFNYVQHDNNEFDFRGLVLDRFLVKQELSALLQNNQQPK